MLAPVTFPPTTSLPDILLPDISLPTIFPVISAEVIFTCPFSSTENVPFPLLMLAPVIFPPDIEDAEIFAPTTLPLNSAFPLSSILKLGESTVKKLSALKCILSALPSIREMIVPSSSLFIFNASDAFISTPSSVLASTSCSIFSAVCINLDSVLDSRFFSSLLVSSTVLTRTFVFPFSWIMDFWTPFTLSPYFSTPSALISSLKAWIPFRVLCNT